MMRFLVVLALLKYASASVIDPSNHKTVSVPLGNGMSVDVDVTVDIDTAGTPENDDECIEDGKKCSCNTCSQKCCSGNTCLVGSRCECGTGCWPDPHQQCTKLYETCGTNTKCCDEDAECRWQEVDDDNPMGHGPLKFAHLCMPIEKCIPVGEPCTRTNTNCCDEDAECKPDDEYEGSGISPILCLPKDHCTRLYWSCENNTKCCDEDAECKPDYREVQGVRKNLCQPKDKGPERPKCAKYLDKCETNSECCDEDAECRWQPPPGSTGPFEHKINICLPGGKIKQCKDFFENCDTDSDCCEDYAECRWQEVDDDDDPGSTKMEKNCLRKDEGPPDCIPDGEPCHGTDDWEHECCSESCCEGKCGKCSFTSSIWN